MYYKKLKKKYPGNNNNIIKNLMSESAVIDKKIRKGTSQNFNEHNHYVKSLKELPIDKKVNDANYLKLCSDKNEN